MRMNGDICLLEEREKLAGSSADLLACFNVPLDPLHLAQPPSKLHTQAKG